MPNNPDILDCGRIERDQDSTGKASKLEWATDVRRDINYGANVRNGDVDPKTDKAIHDAMAANIGNRRNKPDEKIPSDSIDPVMPGPQPKRKP